MRNESTENAQSIVYLRSRRSLLIARRSIDTLLTLCSRAPAFVKPDPVVRVFAQHTFEGRVTAPGRGEHVLLRISRLRHLDIGKNAQDMTFALAIANDEHRNDWRAGQRRQSGRPRRGRSREAEEVGEDAVAPRLVLIRWNDDQLATTQGADGLAGGGLLADGPGAGAGAHAHDLVVDQGVPHRAMHERHRMAQQALRIREQLPATNVAG